MNRARFFSRTNSCTNFFVILNPVLVGLVTINHGCPNGNENVGFQVVTSISHHRVWMDAVMANKEAPENAKAGFQLDDLGSISDWFPRRIPPFDWLKGP